MKSTKTKSDAPLLTVYYDGSCSLCRTRVAIYKIAARREAVPIVWRDVAEEPEALAEFGIDGERARLRLHVVDADGGLFAGADAFALLWSALPGYRRLGCLAAAPGFNALAHAVYESGLAQKVHRLRRAFRRRGGASAPPAEEGRAS